MIPEPIYERMPYVYVVTGATITLLDVNAVAWVCGGLLYVLGGWIWVLRSCYRRPDRARVRLKLYLKRDLGRGRYLPFRLYEALPFLYIAAGGSAFSLLPSGFGWLPGAMLILAGVLVWRMRFNHRMLTSARQAFA